MRWNSNNVRNSQSTAIVAGLLMMGLGITGLAISGAARAACTNVKMPFRPAAFALPGGSSYLSNAVYLAASGNSFTGSYTANVYLESASDPFNEDSSNIPIASGGGNVTATRVLPDPAP